MTTRARGLRDLRAIPDRVSKKKMIVFVHGILSSSRTFDALVAALANDERFADYHLGGFDYDWSEPILKSAERLRRILNNRFRGSFPEVTLIGHSMGGLVSRFALIGDDLPCVKRIIMLGTPNFGALTAAQLSTLWQVSVAAAGVLTPFFPRTRGLRDLTRIQSIYREVTDAAPNAANRADQVEYITVPGLYYHRERVDLDPGDGWTALPFTAGRIALAVMALWPHAEIELERPHDGIVEESSVSMLNPTADAYSEKSLAIQEPGKYGRSYAHITPVSSRDDTHMQIQGDQSVVRMIQDVILTGSVLDWNDSMPKSVRRTFIDIKIP
jgi:pimeloyl-ACP methyl ester carboxylesterase